MARHFAERPAHAAPQSCGGGGRHLGSLVAGVALLSVGAVLFFAPSVSAVIEQQRADEAVDAFRREVTVTDAVAGSESSEDSSEGYRAKEGDATYQALVTYNEDVRSGTGDAVNDPFAFSGEDLDELGLPEGIIGSIEIPKMSVSLPLYLGATDENLTKGAAVVAGTSMPIGETSSNCVIAAHRSRWYGMQMFRDIELLEPGDTITITTPWDTLTYEVRESRIISPTDADALAVEEGHDMVTLLTCHPYTYTTQRYVVFCERVDNSEAQESPGVVSQAVAAFLPAPAEDSPALGVELAFKVIGLVVLLGTGVFLVVDAVRRARRR